MVLQKILVMKDLSWFMCEGNRCFFVLLVDEALTD